MQALHRISQTDPTDLKELIEQGAGEIARRWLGAVRADLAVPSTEGVAEPLLLAAIPSVLDEILCVIELDESKIKHEKLCSAAQHGRERARAHFDVRELVREYQLLREQIFLYLDEHVPQFAERDVSDVLTIYRRVGLAIDEAMRETINGFVEEHTAQLRHLSRTDSLTGLYNHRIFYERLDEELKRATRYQKPLSIVLIDLDNFKAVNDTNGHQFGDYLLTKCAEWLRHELRQTDVLCRYGGDEFGVILPETTRAEAHSMMARLPDAFRKLGTQAGAPASFGMSFGLAAHPEDNGTTTTRLVQSADERLLLNKQRNSS
jgi:diguanylate cyclase (GGDEF)-like protein